MKTVQLDDDVYAHLLSQVQVIGEDASSILRRLLKIPVNSAKPKTVINHDEPLITTKACGRIDECIEHPHFQMEREAIGKFLFTLSWLHKMHGEEEFSKILAIRGRKRLYYAKSADELDESGSSVYPQRIPNTSYWVVTNNDTPKKQRMLSDVMRVLGYPFHEIERLTAQLD